MLDRKSGRDDVDEAVFDDDDFADGFAGDLILSLILPQTWTANSISAS